MKIFRFFVLLFGLVAPITLGSVIAQDIRAVTNPPQMNYIIIDGHYCQSGGDGSRKWCVYLFSDYASAANADTALKSSDVVYSQTAYKGVLPFRSGVSSVNAWAVVYDTTDTGYASGFEGVVTGVSGYIFTYAWDSAYTVGDVVIYEDGGTTDPEPEPEPEPDPTPESEIHKITYPITTKREGDFFYQDGVLYTRNDSYSGSGKYINGFMLKIYSTPNGWIEGVPDAHGLEVCRTVAEMVVNSFASYVASYDFGGVELEGVSLTPICAPYYSSSYSTSEPLGYIVVLFPSRTGTSYNVGNLCKSCATDFYYNEGWASFYWLGAVGSGDMVNINFSQNSETYASKPSTVSTSSFSVASLDEARNVQSTAELSEGSALPVSVSYVPSVVTTVDSGGDLATTTPEVATTSDISVQSDESGEATIVINQETTVNYDFELGEAPDELGYDKVETQEVEVKDNEEKDKYTLKYFYETGDGIRLDQEKLWDEVDEKFSELFPKDKIEEFLETVQSGGAAITPITCSFMVPPFAQTWSFTVDLESYASMSVIQIIRGMAGFFVSLETLLMCVRLMA
ncbi:MAG: hypothetical protein Q4C70_05285 [Planctomycetia bacterium]|nr:hypothetical protein [Planctomycetia bacterium]